MGIPVVISDNGIPVRPVDDGWPVMTVAQNGLGTPITISDDGAPFVVQGLVPPEPVNLIVNGDFATDTIWDKGDGWSITGGVAVGAPDVAISDLSQPIAITAGNYRCTYTVVTRTAGSVHFRIYGNGMPVAGSVRAAPGTYTEDIYVPIDQTTFAIRKNALFNGSIDDVELYYLGP